MDTPLRLGISSCLLGHQVRFDGQHKLDHFLADTLGRFVTYVPVCPEVECGLPVPREPMHLEGDPDSPRLVTIRTRQDLTGLMQDWAACRIEELAGENLCGFIFKSGSPSSGMERVKVYNGHGGLSGRGAGMFAAAFMRRFPLLPVEDEGRLNDPDLRENFIERIFTLHRYREAATGGVTVRALTEFHARHKLLIMAHSPDAVRRMGRLLAGAAGRPLNEVTAAYEDMLLQALRLIATPRKHTNVLQHMAGYFRGLLDDGDRQELQEVIRRFHAGLLPLIVPVTLVAHHARRHGVDYLLQQVYLDPHPVELKLRNHA